MKFSDTRISLSIATGTIEDITPAVCARIAIPVISGLTFESSIDTTGTR
jgi:hypothetical protein